MLLLNSYRHNFTVIFNYCKIVISKVFASFIDNDHQVMSVVVTLVDGLVRFVGTEMSLIRS